MSIAEGLAQDLQFEREATRKMLEAVPMDKKDWRPHEKSMTLQHLAGHIAENPQWVETTMSMDVFEMDPAEYKPYLPATTAEMVETYNKNVALALSQLAGATDDVMMKPWKMVVGGQPAFEMPKAFVIAGFVVKHTIHHRGQLSVYLRMLDVPLPQIYGPTADNPM